MGVATSKRTVPLMRQMARFGWEAFFDPIITPDDVTHGKPHPETLELMQARTGLAPEEILMVGDTPFDLDMARAAGVPSLAVGHGFYPQEALAACGPRAYAPDTAALRDILLAYLCPGGTACSLGSRSPSRAPRLDLRQSLRSRPSSTQESAWLNSRTSIPKAVPRWWMCRPRP